MITIEQKLNWLINELELIKFNSLDEEKYNSLISDILEVLYYYRQEY